MQINVLMKKKGIKMIKQYIEEMNRCAGCNARYIEDGRFPNEVASELLNRGYKYAVKAASDGALICYACGQDEETIHPLAV